LRTIREHIYCLAGLAAANSEARGNERMTGKNGSRDRAAASRPNSDKLLNAYNDAWDHYHARCLWNVQRVEVPDAFNAWHVARRLRLHGDLTALELAVRLERLAGPQPNFPPL
jgi:hypothetical protein